MHATILSLGLHDDMRAAVKLLCAPIPSAPLQVAAAAAATAAAAIAAAAFVGISLVKEKCTFGSG